MSEAKMGMTSLGELKMHISHLIVFLVSIVILTSCTPRGSENPDLEGTTALNNEATVSLATTPGQTVSPRQAVLKAIDLSGGLGLFRDAVVIDGSKQEDGSVLVQFSRPVWSSDEAASKSGGNILFKMTVGAAGIVTEPPVAKEDGKSRKKEVDSEDVRLSKAALAVCTELFKHSPQGQEEALNFELIVRKTPTGYSVVDRELPYMPGGYTAYELSESYVITEEIPGM